jgi:hypothetical protein
LGRSAALHQGPAAQVTLQTIHKILKRSDFASRRITAMKTRSSLVLLVTAVSSLAAFTASGHPSSGIVVDQKGNVFFSNMSHGVLKIDPQGKVTTVGGFFTSAEIAWMRVRTMPPNKNHWSERGRATSVANADAPGATHVAQFRR